MRKWNKDRWVVVEVQLFADLLQTSLEGDALRFYPLQINGVTLTEEKRWEPIGRGRALYKFLWKILKNALTNQPASHENQKTLKQPK